MIKLLASSPETDWKLVNFFNFLCLACCTLHTEESSPAISKWDLICNVFIEIVLIEFSWMCITCTFLTDILSIILKTELQIISLRYIHEINKIVISSFVSFILGLNIFDCINQGLICRSNFSQNQMFSFILCDQPTTRIIQVS